MKGGDTIKTQNVFFSPEWKLQQGAAVLPVDVNDLFLLSD
jgi:hypothetical protein